MQIVEETSPFVETDPQKIKRLLDERGISYSWLAEKIDVTPAWVTRIFSGTLKLTEERKSQIQEVFSSILNIKL